MDNFNEILLPDIETLVTKVMKLDMDNIFCIVAKYEDTVDIVSELIGYGVYPYFVELMPKRWNGYDREYLITVNSGNQLFVEPLYVNGRYLDVLDDLGNVYILEDCNHKIINKCKNLDKIYFIYFDECNGYQEDFDKCTGGCDEDKETLVYTSESTNIDKDSYGRPTGFTKSWCTIEDGTECYSSYSFSSNVMDVLREVAKDWDVML